MVLLLLSLYASFSITALRLSRSGPGIASFPPASEFRPVPGSRENSETCLSPTERDDGGQVTRNDLSINAFVLVTKIKVGRFRSPLASVAEGCQN